MLEEKLGGGIGGEGDGEELKLFGKLDLLQVVCFGGGGGECIMDFDFLCFSGSEPWKTIRL